MDQSSNRINRENIFAHSRRIHFIINGNIHIVDQILHKFLHDPNTSCLTVDFKRGSKAFYGRAPTT